VSVPRKKIVLYFPLQADPRGGVGSSKDLLPLSVLTLAAWPERDGFEVVVIDGNLYPQAEAHRRVVEACRDAILFGTTGILGYQVTDGWLCAQKVRAVHPRLTTVIGGWFASAAPEIVLATGLFDAACLGQGEITFRELARAVECGEPLESIAGLALWRDGQVVRTEHRSVVGWDELLDCPWHLLDIEPYRSAQLAGRAVREVERMVVPPGFDRKPWFGISYYSSFGCPEPCAFCCSPEISGLRWKAMPAARMLDDLGDLSDRWGFDSVRFYDANFGVAEKRLAELAEGLQRRGSRFWWYALMQSSSIARYKDSTLEALRDSGMYVVQLGGETGDEATMKELGKHTRAGQNLAAAERMSRLGICSLVTYIIGYPGESEASMLATLDEARALAASSPLVRATVWPYRPLPGTGLWEPSLRHGYQPPTSMEAWGETVEYHFRETWPGQIPARILRARRLYEHFATLSLGLARGRVGWWERRAQRWLRHGGVKSGRIEAKAFDLAQSVARKLPSRRSGERAVQPGHQTAVLSGRAVSRH
jgi:radical SAM superfamily enzyme YgiQ (UPF0313 family)